VKPARGAFSILLPCFSIAIWLALVVMPVAGMYFRLRDRLPVWWFAGRGIDAMLGRRRLGFLSLMFGTAVIFGTAVFLIFAILFLGFSFALPPNELDGGRWIVWGPALWFVLFAAFPYDIYRRWSAGRKTCRLKADLG